MTRKEAERSLADMFESMETPVESIYSVRGSMTVAELFEETQYTVYCILRLKEGLRDIEWAGGGTLYMPCFAEWRGEDV